MSRSLDVATSWLGSVLRFGAGLYAHAPASRPGKPLQLYEFEACPYCRKVREALTELDLDAMIFPCPKGGRFRTLVEQRGGKAQFPYLVDPNTDIAMYESMDIIAYLRRTYDAGRSGYSLGLASTIGGSLVSGLRASSGRRVRAAKQPAEPLVLYSFEASPYCRIVRERLCELDLPYHLINVGKRSPSRPAFVARSSKMMVPYLEDPNTGTRMFESADIVAYLDATYAA